MLKRVLPVGFIVVFVCLLAVGCHTSNRCPGCHNGACPAGVGHSPESHGAYPNQSQVHEMPSYQAPLQGGSGTR